MQAQACLAESLEKQRGLAGKAAEEQSTKDEREAFAWRLKAARKGNAEAQFHVGRMLAEGRGTTKDLRQVRFFFPGNAVCVLCGAWVLNSRILCAGARVVAEGRQRRIRPGLGRARARLYCFSLALPQQPDKT